jgi:hypothetical protein
VFLTVDVIESDVLGLKVDVFVVDVSKVDVLEVVQMGRPGKFAFESKQKQELFQRTFRTQKIKKLKKWGTLGWLTMFCSTIHFDLV